MIDGGPALCSAGHDHLRQDRLVQCTETKYKGDIVITKALTASPVDKVLIEPINSI